MSQKTLYYFFLTAVLIGLVDTLYLSLTVLLDVAPVCGPLHGCETVAASPYSKLAGIPLAYLGVIYYAVGAFLSGFLETSRRARLLAVAYGVLGATLSVWFIYVQAVLIKEFCVYCLISAAAAGTLCVLAVALYKRMVCVSTLDV